MEFLYVVAIIFLIIGAFVILYYTVGFEKFMPIIIVDAQEAWVIDNRLGKDRVIFEGINRIVPGVEVVVGKVSLKELTIDPPAQDIITRDNINITVDMIASIKIIDAQKAVMDVDNYKKSVESLVMTSALNIMGNMNLVEIQRQIDSISKDIMKHMGEDTKRWGLAMIQVHIEEIKLPDNVKAAMEKEVVAEKEQKAMLLLAKAKKEAAIEEAEGKKIAAGYHADSILHEIEMLKESMPGISNEKILEFLTSLDYIHSMKNLSASDNTKVVVYPADLQKSMNGFMPMPGLDEQREQKS